MGESKPEPHFLAYGRRTLTFLEYLINAWIFQPETSQKACPALFCSLQGVQGVRGCPERTQVNRQADVERRPSDSPVLPDGRQIFSLLGLERRSSNCKGAQFFLLRSISCSPLPRNLLAHAWPHGRGFLALTASAFQVIWSVFLAGTLGAPTRPLGFWGWQAPGTSAGLTRGQIFGKSL